MKEQKIRFTPIPSTAEVEAERERLAYRSRYKRAPLGFAPRGAAPRPCFCRCCRSPATA